MAVEYSHVIEVAAAAVGAGAATVIPLVLYIASNRRADQKERAAARQSETEKRDAEHKENKEMLETLCTERKYFGPHDHYESEGQLMVDGIRRPPRNGK